MRPLVLAAFFAVGLFLACGTPINVDVGPSNEDGGGALEAGAAADALSPITDAGDGGTPITPGPDTGVPEGTLRVVQTAYASVTASSQLGLKTPTLPGSLLVVAIANTQVDAGAFTSSVVDGKSNAYVQPDAPTATGTPCGCSTTIWYAKSVAAGTQTITVTANDGVSNIWILEVAGIGEPGKVSAALLANTSTVLGPDSGLHVAAPALSPSVAIALVVSAACSCTKIETLESKDFTEIPMPSSQTKAAYTITTKTGTYSAIWGADIAAAFAASTAAFTP